MTSTVRQPSPAAPVRPGRGPRRVGAVGLPLLVALLFTGLYATFSLAQWHRGEVPSWDNAIFTQLLKSYAAGQPPIVDIKGHGFNLLGDHFHPLLVVLAPVYWLFPSALTLMITQDVLLGASAGIITWFAVRALHPAPAVAVGVAYGLSFGLQNAVAVQFHEVSLAVPLLALGLGFLRERRWTAAALWTAPVALVKEDLGITVAVVGALMLAHAVRPTLRVVGRLAPRPHLPGGREHRGDRAASTPRQLATARALTLRCPATVGTLLMLWGTGASLLAVTVVLPGLNPHDSFAYADRLDVSAILRDPAAALVSLVTPQQKLGTWALTLAAGAVIAVRSPLAVVALPTLAWRMLSPNHGYWGWGWHYNAVVMPVVFLALLDAVVRLRAVGAHRDGPRRLARCAPWVALAVSVVVATQQPLVELTHQSTYREDPRAASKREIVATVAEGASVATDLSLINLLVSRADVHWIGTPGDPAPQYVVVDRDHGTWGGDPPDDVASYARELYGEAYVTLRDQENIALVVRTTP